MDHAERLARFGETDLYVVITGQFCAGRPVIDVLETVLAAGVGIVQLREKNCSDRELFILCQAFRERTKAAGALLIVDDRLDVALAGGADGVHLGQDDLPWSAARRLAPELIIGASTHTLQEALAAQSAGVSYLNIGPIFPTQTKSVAIDPVGPEMIDEIKPNLNIPFTCMGGINLDNIDQVTSRGARHVAVVTAVTAASDVREAAARLREKIRNFA